MYKCVSRRDWDWRLVGSNQASKVKGRLPKSTLSGEGTFPCDVVPIELGHVDIRVSGQVHADIKVIDKVVACSNDTDIMVASNKVADNVSVIRQHPGEFLDIAAEW